MRNLLKITGVLFLVMFLSAMVPLVSSAEWFIETVGSEEIVGGSTAIALDSSDNVHISYYSNAYPNINLKHATNASGSWVTETEIVDSYEGAISIAFDSLFNVHISYRYLSYVECYDPSEEDCYDVYGLKHATNASGSWVTETAPSYGSVWETAIALDSSDNVHISYYVKITDWGVISYNLKYVTNDSGSWVTQTVDSDGDVGDSPAIAIDSSDNVHISYYDNTNYSLKYATNASGSWVTQTVNSAADVGHSNAIALDLSDNVHISYYEVWPNKDLKYATNASGSWVTETVDNDYYGQYPSIAIDSQDKVHISVSYLVYYDCDIMEDYDCVWDYDLKYATNASGSWVTETVDTGHEIYVHSIALDSSDNVHISYREQGFLTNDALKYATNVSVPDTIRPTVTITSPQNKPYNNSSVELSFYADEPTRWAGYKLDGGSWTTVVGGSTTLTNLSDGQHKVKVSMADLAGNHGYSTVYFTVDTTRPTVTITSPESKKYSTNYVNLSFYADEPTRWAGYKLDKDPWVTVIGGSTTLTNLSNGTHKVRVSMADLAGNHGYAWVRFNVRVSKK